MILANHLNSLGSAAQPPSGLPTNLLHLPIQVSLAVTRVYNIANHAAWGVNYSQWETLISLLVQPTCRLFWWLQMLWPLGFTHTAPSSANTSNASLEFSTSLQLLYRGVLSCRDVSSCSMWISPIEHKFPHFNTLLHYAEIPSLDCIFLVLGYNRNRLWQGNNY